MIAIGGGGRKGGGSLDALASGRELVTASQLLSSAEGREPAPAPPARQPSPLVSVVIPALNEQACIAGAIGSVAMQQYPADRLECVVAEVVLDLARRWEASPRPTPRLSLVREPQRGVGPAKNRGAAAAGGEVLVFLDADSTLGADGGSGRRRGLGRRRPRRQHCGPGRLRGLLGAGLLPRPGVRQADLRDPWPDVLPGPPTVSASPRTWT